MRGLLFLLLLCSCTTTPTRSVAEEVRSIADPLTACAGRWIHRGPQTKLGRSIDHVLEIARGKDGWTLTIDRVIHPGLRPKRPDEVESRRAGEPSSLHVEGDRLVYWTPLHADGLPDEVRQTFRLDGDKLYFPAWVRRGACEWVYSDSSENLVIRTEHDPSVVASGAAAITGLPLRQTPITYTAVSGPDPHRPGVEELRIHFTQPGENGAIEDAGRFVDNSQWGRAYMQFNTVLEPAWTRLTDEEWASIEALPALEEPRR